MKSNKKQIPTYERIGVLSLESVFPYIKSNFYNPGRQKINIDGYEVNVQSLRLRTFLTTGIQCPCCPSKASFFAVERNYGTTTGYHLNLYGIDEKNNEVLFTHDHIVARGLGGEDNITNSRTMCGPCNWQKGKLEAVLKHSTNEETKVLILKELAYFMPKQHHNKEAYNKQDRVEYDIEDIQSSINKLKF